MNTVGAILSSMPADPRMAPGSLSQATATPHGPAGATAQTSGFVEAKSGDGTHVTGVSSTKPSTSTTTSSSTNQSTSPGSSLLAEAEARFSSISAGIGSFLSSGGSADGHPPVLPAGHSTTGFLTGFNPSLQPGGGLATNPLVPRPGESIDPATGKPHQAGLTRAQLEAKRAAEASGASIAASSMSGTASGSGTHLEDLSGREQAARQLTGTVPVPALAPAPALPGTRIGAPIDPAGANGTGHHSVLDDVNHGLEKVVDMLPQGLKERLAGVNDPKGKMSEAEREKRLSAQGILESARQQGGRIFQDFKESFNEDFRSSPKSDKSGAGSTGVIASVKELWTDVTGPGAGNLSKGPSVFTHVPPADKLTAQAAAHSGGVGDLPGKPTEAGVAVLPDEKVATEKEQRFLPGEVAGGSKTESAADKAVPIAAVTAVAAGSAVGADAALAPPLPATTLGSGAAHGATDLDSVAGVSTDSATSIEPATAQRVGALDVAPRGERSTSMASVTAISRGHEGVRHSTTSSPLANDANVSGPNDNSLATGAAEGAGVAGATALVGSLALKDSAPGRHEDGVGHPSTRAPETTREPGSYPKADLSGEADHDHKPSTMTSTESKNATSTASAAGGLGPAGTVAPDSDRAQTQTPTTTSNQSHTTAGHDGKRRTSSGGSSKKKVGFMSKLKGEIKVISGKLDHDKEKVEAGKRMIHGE